MKLFRTLLSFALFFLACTSQAKTVHYNITVEQKPVNLSGKATVDFSLVVNGGIPAPTLEFTEGDDAEITVTNKIPTGEDVSIHWHGLLLPPEEDGVPYVNTPPIFKDESRTFHFKLRQSGTYWYHSHTMLQEQKGVFGAIVIHPRKETIKADKEVVVMLNDWSDENAESILGHLKKDGDYYLYKKNTMRSYFGAFFAGKLGNQLGNEWVRMGGMDLSDVGYDAFLINGKRESQLADLKPGQRVRVRIINAASSSYFQVSLAGLPMQVVAADGIDVQPLEGKEILMGMAETYDVLFTVPEGGKNFELRATSQDGTGFASSWIGSPSGEKVYAAGVPKPDPYGVMDHDMSGMDMSDMEYMDMSPTYQINVDKLKSLTPKSWPKNVQTLELKLVLNGDMRRYVWHINGKTISEDRLIHIHAGELVRITYQNDSMMHHPMHLHGHFFRVKTDKGADDPIKHTVDVPPMGSRTIEFLAEESGQWMLHCHNLYHMMGGMARVVKYDNYTPSPEMAMHEQHDHHMMDPFYPYGKLEVSSNHARAYLRTSQSWNQFEARAETANIRGKNFSFSDKWDFEGDLFFRRWLGNFSSLIVGGTHYGERAHAVAGFGYTLPMLIEAQFLINHEGQLRLDLNRKLQWTKHVFSEIEFMWRPDYIGGDQGAEHPAEIEVSLMYSPSWSWSAGLMFTNDSVGGGLELQF